MTAFSLLANIQKTYSGLRKNITLSHMNKQYTRLLNRQGSGVGNIHISRFTTPEDAQTIISRASEIKNLQHSLVKTMNRPIKTPRIHAPNANLTGLILPEGATILARANLKKANLQEAKLPANDLKHANLKKANLYQLQAPNTSFEGANLSRVDLNLSNLQNANLKNTTLTRALLYRSNLQYANLDRSRLNHILLDEANLSHTSIQNAKLVRARVSDANLNQANLSGSNLSYSQMDRSLLYQTNLAGTNLNHAQLSQALIDEKRIRVANNVSTAILPTYFTVERNGYNHQGGRNNLGVKIGKNMVSKRMLSNDTRELHTMKRIEERLVTLEKTDPKTANMIRGMLVRYKTDFIDPKNPEHQYLIMEKATGVPLETIHHTLSKKTKQAIEQQIDEQNNLFVKYLGLYLDDRDEANIFVQPDKQGIELDAKGKPILQHIDYGMATWDDNIHLKY
ncbi:MAG: pentapeptide repeat-containing protein [Vampirovibrionales bacterium]